MSDFAKKYNFTQKLYESANSLVYRGYHIVNNQSVILKVLKQSYPSPEKIAWFKQEYETTRNLNLIGVVEVYRLENDQHNWLMVLEDFGGESLERLIEKRSFSTAEFLPLAIEIVDILAQVHQQQIIHKDINPSNIVWNQTTGKIKLIDFGISTLLAKENSTFRSPNLLTGTLAYISPEQTGRMNRAIDYRTDFYSLGVTFYELLTDRLPFSTDDSLELLHSHIARQPLLPHQCQPDIPLVLSQIVEKLMAKNPEHRYQSAYGLKADLEACLNQWQTQERIEPFPLGKQDITDRFQIPQQLYGRETEIAILTAAIARVGEGAREMILVSGYSGIGKSALVQEVYQPLTQQQGYFISGKFDQLQRDIPYASIIQAFRTLIKQILTESQDAIANWREQLLDILGANGQVIIEVIPEVELIIGKQPKVPVLTPTETQNRFNLVLQNFIKVFTQREHPLVIFLDDLQWADRASLTLIQLLMTAADSQYLCLIGAYRNNEVSPAHPLMVTLEEIRKTQAIVQEISLAPLELLNVTELIADTLQVERVTAQPLAELVHTKTGGNPFFINEFLKSLSAQGLFSFDYGRGCWQWDLGQIQAQPIADNVVTLMAQKVQKLPTETQAVLKLAACVGNQFDLETLAIVNEKSLRETAVDLWAAIAEGFILPLSDTYKLMELDVEGISEQLQAEYKFAHDRIQQAVYFLIPEADKQAVHLHLGQLLLQNTTLEAQEQKLFDIVNQLNKGQSLIDQQPERNNLAELNLQAGQKAKASAAYQSAFNYLMIGIELLGENTWQVKYELTLKLYQQASEAAYLIGKFDQMEQWVEKVLQQAQTLLDKVAVYEIQIQAYYSQNKPQEAVDMALEVLKLLGVVFPEQPNESDFMQSLQSTQSALGERQILALLDLPKMTEPVKLAAMRILGFTVTTIMLLNPSLFLLSTLTMVNLSLQYGNAIESTFGYVTYSLILCDSLREIETGYQFGQLALGLLEQFNSKQLQARILVMANDHTKIWKQHVRETLSDLVKAYQVGIETGDLQFAALSGFIYCLHTYLMGRELAEVEREMAKYAEAIAQLKQEGILDWHQICRQSVLKLMGLTEDRPSLGGELYDEAKMLPIHLIILCLNRMVIDYLFGNIQQAFESTVKIKEEYLNTGGIFIPTHCFYDSLIRLGVFTDTSEPEQKSILEKVNINQEKMELWAKHAPMNYLHKFYLVEAERARVLGQHQDAREYYDQAISLAHENEYLNEEALAHELAGRFYLARSQNHVARNYLQDAYYAYQRWGAIAKVKDLETRYPQFLATAAKDTPSTRLPTPTTSENETATEVFDFHSVLRASQAISGEILLDQLLEKLIKVVIENAGAQTGFLLLEREEKLLIKAEINVNNNEIIVKEKNLVKNSQFLPISIINYVRRTKENVVLQDATTDSRFAKDTYLGKKQVKSLLCTPIINQGQLIGLLYLENNLTTGAFTQERLETLRILSAQAAISIENARLYTQLEDYNRNLEQRVEERTQELSQTLEVLKA
ncbi:MAG: AAA family ATPase, partial [Symploca sp. SIO2G7]|nr:AAA family ATPase [Symploca sp. SIO2G7]